MRLHLNLCDLKHCTTRKCPINGWTHMVIAACSWDVAFFFPVLRLLVFAVNVAILGVDKPKWVYYKQEAWTNWSQWSILSGAATCTFDLFFWCKVRVQLMSFGKEWRNTIAKNMVQQIFVCLSQNNQNRQFRVIQVNLVSCPDSNIP